MVIIKCMKEIKTKCIKINRIPNKKTSFLTKTINIWDQSHTCQQKVMKLKQNNIELPYPCFENINNSDLVMEV